MRTGYTPAFYQGEETVALAAARVVLPGVLALVGHGPVADVGCGTGAWLSVAKEHGCSVHGFDTYQGPLLIDPDEYTGCDLTRGASCNGYALALCLEVGEHLPEASATALVAGLCEARYVLFSAAIPGQPGVHHVNCQWGTWWAERFAEHGYVGSSDYKWAYWYDQRVADFYRQNLLFFARPNDRLALGLRPGVIDVIHPERAAQH